MLNFRTLLLLGALGLTLSTSTSCQKEEDPCEGVSCQNGGSCVNGQCDCPQGYTGPSCTDQETPRSMSIERINLTRFPAYNNGSDWDLWTPGPDVYLVLSKNGQIVRSMSTFWEDADAGQSYLYEPNTPIDLSDPTVQYTLSVFDYDSSGDDDYMGGIQFYPYSNNNGFPSQLSLDANGAVAYQVQVTYSW